MSEEYFIIGSGGFAKEVHFLADQIFLGKSVFKGFIDFKPETNFVYSRGEEISVFDEEEFLKRYSGISVSVFIGVGDPLKIRSIVQKFQGFDFPNLIHPNSNYDEKSVSLGQGNIITSGCNFTVDIKIGNFNIFNLDSTIGHDCIIGNYNVINPGTQISGGVKIGDANLFGTNSAVLQYLEIGSNCILGAGALLTKAMENQVLALGVPATFKKIEI